MAAPLHIMWFRQDLRLADNRALAAAAADGARVLPLFILDDGAAGEWARGGAGRWWLHHALTALDESLSGRLVVLQGEASVLLPEIVRATGAEAVFWNRCYEPWRVARDTALKEHLRTAGCRVESRNSSLLWEPWEVLKADGTPYKVFTPYYRRGCLRRTAPRPPRPRPEQLKVARIEVAGRRPIAALQLLSPVGWQDSLAPHWTISEAGAQAALTRFLDEGLVGYKGGRDFPGGPHASRLSPHLHSGTISPHQVWQAVHEHGPTGADRDHFCSELGWREFSYALLYHFPTFAEANFQAKFDRFPWLWESPHLAAWQQGRTGIPLVDAGMRELWRTGVMHNRVRMVAASFLVKNLLVHWRLGAEWFWDTLVDADLANNSAGWQWVAGSGADAAPYFRIFNPVTQGKKFDPQGVYVRRFVPELADLPDRWLHEPWAAPKAVLADAGVELGATYPRPVVSLATSREQALAALATLR